MLKENKWKAIISSVVILLPVLVGIILWNDLPGNMVVHWDMSGTPDGQGVKAGVVIGMPLLLLALHWLCILTTGKDRGNKNQSKKVFGMLFWIMPVLSLFVSGITYTTAFGWNVDIKTIMGILLGLLFVVLGNYMPKCKQSYTMGYKLPWTLSDEANWNATHRFAGWVMTIGGVILLVTSPFAILWISLPVMIVTALAPVVYSFIYYLRHK